MCRLDCGRNTAARSLGRCVKLKSDRSGHCEFASAASAHHLVVSVEETQPICPLCPSPHTKQNNNEHQQAASAGLNCIKLVFSVEAVLGPKSGTDVARVPPAAVAANPDLLGK